MSAPLKGGIRLAQVVTAGAGPDVLVHPKPRHVLLGWRSSLWQWAGGRGVLTGAGICESAYPTGTQARCKGSLQWQWSWRCSGGGEEDNTISQLRQLILLLPVAGTKQTLSRDHTPSLSYQAQNPAQRSLHSTSKGPKPGEAWEPACQPWARALGGFVVQCTRLLKETGVL